MAILATIEAVLLLCLLAKNVSLNGDVKYEQGLAERSRQRADNNACALNDCEKKSAELRWQNKLLTEKLRASEEAMTRLDEYHKSTLPKL